MIQNEHWVFLIPEAKPKYSNWTLTGPARKNKNHFEVECKCACGKVKWVRFHSLAYGASESCGCLRHLGRSTKVLYQGHKYLIKDICYLLKISWQSVYFRIREKNMTPQQAFDEVLSNRPTKRPRKPSHP
jgi:hypothetical protein